MSPQQTPHEIFAQEQAAEERKAKEAARLTKISKALSPHLNALAAAQAESEQDKDYLARLTKAYIGIGQALKKYKVAVERIGCPISNLTAPAKQALTQHLRLLNLAGQADRATVRRELVSIHEHRKDGFAWWFFQLNEQFGFPAKIWEAVKAVAMGEPTPSEKAKMQREKGTQPLAPSGQ